jgi:hypothetical protein
LSSLLCWLDLDKYSVNINDNNTIVINKTGMPDI